MEWQVWDGDLYLYTVYTSWEADEAAEGGLDVKAVFNDMEEQ